MKLFKEGYEFGRRELAFIAIICVAIIVAGAYAWQAGRGNSSVIDSFETCVAAGNPVMESYPERCAADGQTYTKKTAEYTDSAGVYKLTYPTNFTLELADNCCEGAPRDTEQESRPVYLKPLKADLKSGEEIRITGGNQSQADYYRRFWKENGHTSSSVKVGNYSAEYVRTDFSSDVERYTDHTYLVYSGPKNVVVNFRESYNHDWYPENSFNDASYLSDVERILYSITIL